MVPRNMNGQPKARNKNKGVVIGHNGTTIARKTQNIERPHPAEKRNGREAIPYGFNRVLATADVAFVN